MASEQKVAAIDGVRAKLPAIRVFSLAIGVAASGCVIAHLSTYSCPTATAGIASAVISALAGSVALYFAIGSLIYSAFYTGDPPWIYNQPVFAEALSIILSVLFYVAVMLAYSARFEPKCESHSGHHVGGLRDAILFLAVIQTGGTVAYATLSRKESSVVSVIISIASTLFALGGTVSYYIHGGETMPCPNQNNEDAEAMFNGVVVVILLSAVALMGGYALEHYDMHSVAIAVFAMGGSALAIITYFLLALLIHDHRETCPFILDQKNRSAGNTAMYLLVFSVALQHTVPISSHKKMSEVASTNGMPRPTIQTKTSFL